MAVTTQAVTFPSHGGTHQVPGYLALPEGAGPFPGIVVIQEWWGLDEHIEDVTRRFAAEGYVAVSPDLYYGKVAREPNDAQKLAMDMDRERAVNDVIGAVEYLRSRPDVGKIAMIGYCMGGRLVWQAATRTDIPAAGAAYYGSPPDPITPLATAAPALLGVFAGIDRIPASLADDLNALWKEAGRTDCEAIVYPESKHGFFNDARPEIHDPAAYRDVWDRTLAFFRKHLG